MIVFIDDEPRRMETYVDELELCYEVKFIDNVDEAINYLEEHQEQVKLLILDMMMPSGQFKDNDTKFGMRTGIALYETIRQKNNDLPIIIFTNLSLKGQKDPEIIQELEKDPNCEFIKKEEVNAQGLIGKVQSILKN